MFKHWEKQNKDFRECDRILRETEAIKEPDPKLEPCPISGEQPHWDGDASDSGTDWNVSCIHHNTLLRGGVCFGNTSKQEAAASWNKWCAQTKETSAEPVATCPQCGFEPHIEGNPPYLWCDCDFDEYRDNPHMAISYFGSPYRFTKDPLEVKSFWNKRCARVKEEMAKLKKKQDELSKATGITEIKMEDCE